MRSLALIAVAFTLILLAPPAVTAAQEAMTIEVTVEPARATVGDRLTLTIIARHPPGTSLEGPDRPGQFLPLELVALRPAETSDIAQGVQETRFEYILTAFRTGEVQLPPLHISATGAESEDFVVQPPPVTIESVLPADGAGTLRGVKPPLAVSRGTPSWVWAALVFAAFAGLTAATMALVRLPLRQAPLPLLAPQEAADAAARRELDSIAAARLFQRGELKEYYLRIGACLRSYLARRFAIPAIALTPRELASRLEELALDRWPSRLAVNLLQQCEAVQYAQYEPAQERAEADLSSAYEIVSLTAQTEATEPGEGVAVPS